MADEAASAERLRASHDDRDQTVELLRAAAGDGRLTLAELDQRLERALTARTRGELAELTGDLSAGPDPGAGGSAEPRRPLRIDCRRGKVRRDGRWPVPRRIDVDVTEGSVVLDFTDASVSAPVLHIRAHVRGGVLRLVTRPGMVVDADEVTVGTGGVKVRQVPACHASVPVRIRVSGHVAGGVIAARPRRRAFWQWIRRRRLSRSDRPLPGHAGER